MVADLSETDADRGMSERMCTSAGRGEGFDSVPLGYRPVEHVLSGESRPTSAATYRQGKKSDVGKIVVCTMLSVDGYTEGPGGDVMAMPMDAAFAEHNTDRARTASSFLFGGTTYRGALTYWPQQHDNPDASPLDHYIAKRYAEGIPITVVSTR